MINQVIRRRRPVLFARLESVALGGFTAAAGRPFCDGEVLVDWLFTASVMSLTLMGWLAQPIRVIVYYYHQDSLRRSDPVEATSPPL
jgi:hypothetical protein